MIMFFCERAEMVFHTEEKPGGDFPNRLEPVLRLHLTIGDGLAELKSVNEIGPREFSFLKFWNE